MCCYNAFRKMTFFNEDSWKHKMIGYLYFIIFHFVLFWVKHFILILNTQLKFTVQVHIYFLHCTTNFSFYLFKWKIVCKRVLMVIFFMIVVLQTRSFCFSCLKLATMRQKLIQLENLPNYLSPNWFTTSKHHL